MAETPDEGTLLSITDLLTSSDNIYAVLSLYALACLCVVWILIMVAWYLCRNAIAVILTDTTEGLSMGFGEHNTDDT